MGFTTLWLRCGCTHTSPLGAKHMKTRKQWLRWTMLLAGFAFLIQCSNAALAQNDQYQNQNDQYQNDQYQGDQNSNSDDQDPPGRVARLNFSQGAVSFQPGGENDWVTAVPNRPMVTGDNLWADENSRAEAHIGSTAIRLDSKTGITFLALDDRTVQLRLAQGSLILRVRHVDDDDTYEVDTPNLAFTILQPGEYRIDVSEDGNQTITTVWSGRGRVTGGGFSHTVLANQSASFTGSDRLDYDLNQIPNADNFDQWAFDRDEREDHADSANYVSREMTGYEDLDQYGDWSYVAGYGTCWRPRAIDVGWAPYRYGHWVWIGPYGWTWVEDEPWGFAPFHYGRWAFVSGGWFWVPGPVVVRPIWAPALVAWVGGGPGFHFSVGVGVGWFPLGPGEVFVPGYRVSRRYVNNVNITNTTVNITKVTNVYNTVVINKTTNITYVNQRVNNSVTVVSRDTFVNARPVRGNLLRVDAKEVASAPVYHRIAEEPVRQSVVGAGSPARVRPPARIISRQVVAQKTPPAAPRPFEVRQQQAGGKLNQEPPARPAQPDRGQPHVNTARPVQDDNFRKFTPQNGQAQQDRERPQAEPQRPAQMRDDRNNNNQPDDRNTQDNRQTFRPPQQERTQQDRTNANDSRSNDDRQPLVKPAPPVQERNQQQEQDEAQKFRNWQQQRPSAPERPQARQPEQKQERTAPPKQEQHQDKPSKPSKPKGR